MRNWLLLACVLTSSFCFSQVPESGAIAPVRIVVRPEHPLIEHRGPLQFLNFDFVLENAGKRPLHLNRITISAWDKGDTLILRRELDENGHPSGMGTIEQRDLAAGGRIGIFNPFYTFGPEIKPARMTYSFFFNDPGYQTATPLDYQYSAEVSVVPEDYVDKTMLSLPIHQRSIIFDGHDFYAHHRRQDAADPDVVRLKLKGNPVRYAYDFCPVNDKGDMYKGSPYRKENWYGYGMPIYATAAGTVVGAANDAPENDFRGKEVAYADIPESEIYKIMGGNYVVIDHGDGEFSYFGHMKTGSVRVKAGDKVSAGEQIGELGFAGDAFIPHLHYMLMDNADVLKAESLPSYFVNFRRILGSSSEDVAQGQVDSGDIVEPEKK